MVRWFRSCIYPELSDGSYNVVAIFWKCYWLPPSLSRYTLFGKNKIIKKKYSEIKEVLLILRWSYYLLTNMKTVNTLSDMRLHFLTKSSLIITLLVVYFHTHWALWTVAYVPHLRSTFLTFFINLAFIDCLKLDVKKSELLLLKANNYIIQ